MIHGRPTPKHSTRFAIRALIAFAAANGLAAEFDARVKWHSTTQWRPATDAQRDATGESRPLDHGADLRLLWRRNVGRATLVVDHATTYLMGDTIESAANSGPTYDQTPTGDERRLLDLTWEVDRGNRHRLLHRFDRLALKYRTPRWAVTVGRDAVSWGSGLVFHPMDLFNPFAPTTVDQDYKAGTDLIRIERLFDDGSDLELLAIARHGEFDADTASVAFKYRALVGASELDVLAARHYGGGVVGLGLRVPIGGALIRSDLVAVDDEVGWTLSGVVNVDYSFPIAQSSVYVFLEYFRNGHGVHRLPDDLGLLPDELTQRLGRGETFTLMRDYLAIGAQFNWHALVSQSLSLIANVRDASKVLQTSIGYDLSDAARLQIGLIKTLGGFGDEFGRLDALRAPDVYGQVAYPTTVGERVSVLDRVASATRLDASRSADVQESAANGKAPGAANSSGTPETRTAPLQYSQDALGIGDGLTIGGGARGFLRVVYFF